MFCFLSLCQSKLLAVPNMEVAHVLIRFLEEVFLQDNRSPVLLEEFIQEFLRVSLYFNLSFFAI